METTAINKTNKGKTHEKQTNKHREQGGKNTGRGGGEKKQKHTQNK